MPRQRCSDRSSRIRPRLTISACLSTRRFVCRRGVLAGSAVGLFARQNAITGHTPHLGLRATQTSAPRSRSAELKADDFAFGTRLAAYCQSIFRPALESIGSPMLNSLARTRLEFASTIGRGRPSAKLATACAVYTPMPGSCCICSMFRGNFPWYRFITIFAVA